MIIIILKVLDTELRTDAQRKKVASEKKTTNTNESHNYCSFFFGKNKKKPLRFI